MRLTELSLVGEPPCQYTRTDDKPVPVERWPLPQHAYEVNIRDCHDAHMHDLAISCIRRTY